MSEQTEIRLESTSCYNTLSLSLSLCRWQFDHSYFEFQISFLKRRRYLTLRRLMLYIYIYMEHPFLMFLDHTQRRSTVGRTPLDE